MSEAYSGDFIEKAKSFLDRLPKLFSKEKKMDQVLSNIETRISQGASIAEIRRIIELYKDGLQDIISNVGVIHLTKLISWKTMLAISMFFSTNIKAGHKNNFTDKTIDGISERVYTNYDPDKIYYGDITLMEQLDGPDAGLPIFVIQFFQERGGKIQSCNTKNKTVLVNNIVWFYESSTEDLKQIVDLMNLRQVLFRPPFINESHLYELISQRELFSMLADVEFLNWFKAINSEGMASIPSYERGMITGSMISELYAIYTSNSLRVSFEETSRVYLETFFTTTQNKFNIKLRSDVQKGSGIANQAKELDKITLFSFYRIATALSLTSELIKEDVIKTMFKDFANLDTEIGGYFQFQHTGWGYETYFDNIPAPNYKDFVPNVSGNTSHNHDIDVDVFSKNILKIPLHFHLAQLFNLSYSSGPSIVDIINNHNRIHQSIVISMTAYDTKGNPIDALGSYIQNIDNEKSTINIQLGYHLYGGNSVVPAQDLVAELFAFSENITVQDFKQMLSQEFKKNNIDPNLGIELLTRKDFYNKVSDINNKKLILKSFCEKNNLIFIPGMAIFNRLLGPESNDAFYSELISMLDREKNNLQTDIQLDYCELLCHALSSHPQCINSEGVHYRQDLARATESAYINLIELYRADTHKDKTRLIVLINTLGEFLSKDYISMDTIQRRDFLLYRASIEVTNFRLQYNEEKIVNFSSDLFTGLIKNIDPLFDFYLLDKSSFTEAQKNNIFNMLEQLSIVFRYRAGAESQEAGRRKELKDFYYKAVECAKIISPLDKKLLVLLKESEPYFAKL
jgi:hypothetical protein